MRTATLTKLTEQEAEALLDLLMYNSRIDKDNAELYFTIANKIDDLLTEVGYAEPEPELEQH